MKSGIHPKYYPKATVHCGCGNDFTVGAAVEHIKTEVCSQCHPFYTKKERVLDAKGQVQKFKERLSKKKISLKKKRK